MLNSSLSKDIFGTILPTSWLIRRFMASLESERNDLECKRVCDEITVTNVITYSTESSSTDEIFVWNEKELGTLI